MIPDINASVGIDTVNNKPDIKNKNTITQDKMQQNILDILANQKVIDKNEDICEALQQLSDKIPTKKIFEKYKDGLLNEGREYLTVKHADGSESYFSFTYTAGNQVIKLIPPGKMMKFIFLKEYINDMIKGLNKSSTYDNARVLIENSQGKVDEYMTEEKFSNSQQKTFYKTARKNNLINLNFVYNDGKIGIPEVTGHSNKSIFTSHQSDDTGHEKEKSELARQEIISNEKEKEMKDASSQSDNDDMENNKDDQAKIDSEEITLRLKKERDDQAKIDSEETILRMKRKRDDQAKIDSEETTLPLKLKRK